VSRYAYEMSREIQIYRHELRWPFYALIMAAMRDADTINLMRLRMCWPEVFAELEARYNAPGGRLPSDPEGDDAVGR
jgi:hypothetical protein